jgi:hypothetical protein
VVRRRDVRRVVVFRAEVGDLRRVVVFRRATDLRRTPAVFLRVVPEDPDPEDPEEPPEDEEAPELPSDSVTLTSSSRSIARKTPTLSFEP